MSNKKENKNDEDIVLEPTEEETGEENLAQKLKDLRSKLTECSKEKSEYLAGWQRAKADYINLEKEFSSRYSEAASSGSERLFMDIVPALDSFELAVGNKEAWESVSDNWRKGVEYILGQLKNALSDNGFSEICPKAGDKVNFEQHMIVETVDTEKEGEDGTVTRVLQKGYLKKDKVVRPAKVISFKFNKS